MHALYQRAMQLFSMRPSTCVGENLTVVALLKTKPQHKPRKPCSPCNQEAMSVAREVCVHRDLKPQLQLGSKRWSHGCPFLPSFCRMWFRIYPLNPCLAMENPPSRNDVPIKTSSFWRMFNYQRPPTNRHFSPNGCDMDKSSALGLPHHPMLLQCYASYRQH